MAPMATPEQAMSPLPVETRRRNQGLAWVLWICVSIAGAVAGAMAAFGLRLLISGGPISLIDALRYVATVVDAMVLAGAQWYFLQRYRLDVYWWVPATVIAYLIAALVLIPSVVRLVVGSGVPVSAGSAVVAGGAALAAEGLALGVAQAVVLRTSVGNIAWIWVPASIVGGALAGALTSAISAQLFGLPALATISLVAAGGALLISASQAPVLYRLLHDARHS
jgi:hypothetical protein